MSAHFTIKGLTTHDETLLGLWQPDEFGATAFSTSATAPDVVWSVSLPRDPVLARHALQTQQDLLQASRLATAQARRTLQQLPSDWLDTPPEVSFSTTNNPETQLHHQLTHLTAPVSFGTAPSAEAETWQNHLAGYQEFMRQLLQLLSPTLLAETRLEEYLQATTTVSLTGSIKTTWQTQASVTQCQLHQQTLNLSLESRVAMLQLAGQISAGAAALAAKFNLPGGQLMALPAAWAYLKEIMTQTQTTLAKTQQAIRSRI